MNRWRWLGLVFLLVAGVMLSQTAVGPSLFSLAGPAQVIDGDTLEIGGRRVRLLGVDAPETGQVCRDAAGWGWRCGVQAGRVLRIRLGQGRVLCRIVGRDRYGRDLGQCAQDGLDLGDWLVRRGWAIPYGDGEEGYEAARGEAEAGRRGLWTGPYVQPADWRRAAARHHRDGAAP